MKRFEAWDTDLKSNIFIRAKLKLTLYYVLFTVAILTVLSIIVYFSFISNLSSNVDGEFVSNDSQRAYITRASDNLRNLIIIIDSGVVLLISFLSYWLSGKTLKPIQETVKSQKRFTADASHELRTPLAVMKTDLEVTLKYPSKEKDRKRSIKRSLAEVNKMSAIVNELLTLSRLDMNEEKMVYKQFNISEMITKTVRRLGSYAETRNVRIKLVNRPNILVVGDALKLQYAVSNVLKNAIDYSADGKKVTVATSKNASIAMISVTDQGIGIPSADIQHIFDRFFRTEKSRNREAGGSGLGLTIAKAIVEKHNGSIEVTSIEKKGTTVQINIPISHSS